jgi:hypothetical protein
LFNDCRRGQTAFFRQLEADCIGSIPSPGNSMLAQISIYLGFIEEVENLMKYPEITSSDTVNFSIGNFDIATRNPRHSDRYDPRLFEALTNHVRKLFILHNEPISLKNIHSKASTDLLSDPALPGLILTYKKIEDYLSSSMNSVTQLSFDFPGSALDKTTVFELLNNYFAATSQHSKPKAQGLIDEINSLTSGALTEIVRVMIIDLINLISEYSLILRRLVCK